MEKFIKNSILAIFIFISTRTFCQTKHELDSLTFVLEKISATDQQYRDGVDSVMRQFGPNSPEGIAFFSAMHFHDSLNMAAVASIIDKYGWLTKGQTSDDANETLFLVIQHAPLDMQLKYLPVLKEAVAEKKATPGNYAMLLDRTNAFQGKFQIYGHQLNYDAKGGLHIFPVYDEHDLDKRRKSIGLPSMQEYLDTLSKYYGHPLPPYRLPAANRYKDKMVIRGSVTDMNNQPLVGVSVYDPHVQLLGKTDSSGFFELIVSKNLRNKNILFKKKGFEKKFVSLTEPDKDVFELTVWLKELFKTR